MTWFFNHHNNMREFCQQHNTFLIRLTGIHQCRSYEQLYEFISSMTSVIKVMHCNLWLRDYWTGFYVTFSGSERKKVMCTKGAFKDCLEMREAINSIACQNI